MIKKYFLGSPQTNEPQPNHAPAPRQILKIKAGNRLKFIIKHKHSPAEATAEADSFKILFLELNIRFF